MREWMSLDGVVQAPGADENTSGGFELACTRAAHRHRSIRRIGSHECPGYVRLLRRPAGPLSRRDGRMPKSGWDKTAGDEGPNINTMAMKREGEMLT